MKKPRKWGTSGAGSTGGSFKPFDYERTQFTDFTKQGTFCAVLPKL